MARVAEIRQAAHRDLLDSGAIRVARCRGYRDPPEIWFRDSRASRYALCLQRVRPGRSAMSAQCPVCRKADTAGRFMSTRPLVYGYKAAYSGNFV